MSATLDQSYAFCRKIAHQYGANFSVGFRFLPRQKRRAVYAAYAFCRWADDIADEDGGLKPAATLDDWQRELDRCYDGHPSHPITIALADALRYFNIPKSAFVALIEGCRQDLVKTRYANFDELLRYCELVAWSISDISLAIFGHLSALLLELIPVLLYGFLPLLYLAAFALHIAPVLPQILPVLPESAVVLPVVVSIILLLRAPAIVTVPVGVGRATHGER